MNTTKRRPTAPIPILIYLLTLLAWLALCTTTYYSDRKARADGRMPQMEVEQGDLSLVNVLKANDKFVCITTDPQLWWYNYENAQVRTVTMRASYSKDPLEICLFYLKKGEDNFSLDQRVYPTVNEDGTYTFILPTTQVSRLRLDVCSDTCVIRDFAVTLNAPRAVWEYYVPSNWLLFLMLILPGMLASAISILHNNILLYIRHGGPLSAVEIRAAVDQEDDDIVLDAIEADTAEAQTLSEIPQSEQAPVEANPPADKPEQSSQTAENAAPPDDKTPEQTGKAAPSAAPPAAAENIENAASAQNAERTAPAENAKSAAPVQADEAQEKSNEPKSEV